MAIILPNGFKITNIEPVDTRLTVANETERLSFSRANVYAGLVVYQRDTNELFVLSNTELHDSLEGWTNIIRDIDTGSFAVTASNIFRGDQIITGSAWITNEISATTASFYGDVTVSEGTLEISSTSDDIFLIKNARNDVIFEVSQSGVITFAVQESELENPAPNGGLYFTSTSVFVGLS